MRLIEKLVKISIWWQFDRDHFASALSIILRHISPSPFMHEKLKIHLIFIDSLAQRKKNCCMGKRRRREKSDAKKWYRGIKLLIINFLAILIKMSKEMRPDEAIRRFKISFWEWEKWVKFLGFWELKFDQVF
jgi:hypothetical protein